jgi:hypothetical protein
MSPRVLEVHRMAYTLDMEISRKEVIWIIKNMV